MSRCILTQLLCCRSRFSHGGGSAAAAAAVALTSNRNFTRNNASSSDGKPSGLGQTTILVQQGCDIQELPVIMRKIGQDDIVALCSSRTSSMAASSIVGNDPMANSFSSSSNNRNRSSSCDGGVPINSSTDSDQVIKRLDECVAITGILSIIDGIPDAELMPEVAVYALDKIIRIGSMIQLKNLEDSNEVYMKLVECIARKSDTKTLLDTLDILRMFIDVQRTIQRLCDELLMRNSDEILTVIEICEAVQKFVQCQQQPGAEKFWSGLADQEKSINENNIKFVYQVLPQLKVSRRMVIGVLERRIRNVFWQLSPDAVVDILEALVECKAAPARTMQTLSRWLNTNIHAVNESQLDAVLRSFTELEYSDHQIEKAIERYVKAKGIKIKAQTLVVNILQHCAKFRLRNAHILNGCSEYFIVNADIMEPGYIRSFFCPFGTLDYQPINSIQFWKVFEAYLERNFDQIDPIDIIEIMLTCVYLEKYPLNFVKHIFNPYFLDQMHTRTPIQQHPRLRSDLKLFDTSLSIECNDYNGPMLPRDHSAKAMWQDGRIKRIVANLTDQWSTVAGGDDKYSKSVVHQQLPLNALYVIDVLIHPAGMGQLWNFNAHTDRDVYVAVLIMLPEHYDSGREHLIGSQSMRCRHFRRLGLKVVTLEYETLSKLRVHSRELHRYLVERMKLALPALG